MTTYRVGICRKNNRKVSNWYADNETQCTSDASKAQTYTDKSEAQAVAKAQTAGNWRGIVEYVK